MTIKYYYYYYLIYLQKEKRRKQNGQGREREKDLFAMFKQQNSYTEVKKNEMMFN